MLEYPELGMEAVWKIEVKDFPAFIVTDDKGAWSRCLHTPARTRRRRRSPSAFPRAHSACQSTSLSWIMFCVYVCGAAGNDFFQNWLG